MVSSVQGQNAGRNTKKDGGERVGEHKQGGRGSNKAGANRRRSKELAVSNLNEKYKLNLLAC